MKKDSTNLNNNSEKTKDKKLLFLGGIVVLTLLVVIFGGKFMQGLFNVGNDNYVGTMTETADVSLVNNLYQVDLKIDDIIILDENIEKKIETGTFHMSYNASDMSQVDSSGNEVSTDGIAEIILSKQPGTGQGEGEILGTIYFQLKGGVEATTVTVLSHNDDNDVSAFTPTVLDPDNPKNDVPGQPVDVTAMSFVVGHVNQAPTITSIEDQTTDINTQVVVTFTVSDDTTSSDNLSLKGASSEQSVVNDSDIVFSGLGSSQTATITPAGEGTTTITITVSDEDGLTTSTSFELTVNTAQLQAPQNVVANGGDGKIDLGWDAVTNADQYKIYQVTDDGGSISFINLVETVYAENQYTEAGSTTINKYTVTGLTNGEEYTYVVTALQGSVESVYSNEVTAIPVAQAPDDHAPTVSNINYSPQNGTTADTITFKATVNDDDIGLLNTHWIATYTSVPLDIIQLNCDETVQPGVQVSCNYRFDTARTYTVKLTVTDPTNLLGENQVDITITDSAQPTADVSGVVFYDADGSGANSNESSIAGVDVKLFLGTTAVSTVQTDTNGHYEFTGLTSGNDYYFKVITNTSDFYTDRNSIGQDQNNTDEPKVAFTFNGTSLEMDIPMYSMDQDNNNEVNYNDLSDIYYIADNDLGINIDYHNQYKPSDLDYNFNINYNDLSDIYYTADNNS